MSYDRSKRKRRRDLDKAKKQKLSVKKVNKGYKNNGKRDDGSFDYRLGRAFEDDGDDGFGGLPGLGAQSEPIQK